MILEIQESRGSWGVQVSVEFMKTSNQFSFVRPGVKQDRVLFSLQEAYEGEVLLSKSVVGGIRAVAESRVVDRSYGVSESKTMGGRWKRARYNRWKIDKDRSELPYQHITRWPCYY